jgi:hypothetical protein
MDDLTYWTRALRQAEAELEAATTRAAINAAAKRVMLAKAELKGRAEGTYSPGVRCSGVGGFLLSAPPS